MKAKILLKIAVPAVVLGFGTVQQAQAVDGCKAILCFAGGMGVPECQPTIREVLRDLSRGRGFPTCSGGGAYGITARIKNEVYYNYNSKYICPDGKTAPYYSSYRPKEDKYRHTCRRIDVTVPAEIAADEEHLNQRYYFKR